MSAQGTLFILPQVAHARATDPQTSHLAASVVNIGLGQMLVLEILTKIGEGTDEQIYEAATLFGQTISQSGARTRRKELQTAGYVKHSGRFGLTKAGGKSAIWEVCK